MLAGFWFDDQQEIGYEAICYDRSEIIVEICHWRTEQIIFSKLINMVYKGGQACFTWVRVSSGNGEPFFWSFVVWLLHVLFLYILRVQLLCDALRVRLLS